MLGKYRTIYKNYLKEYKKTMYDNLKSKDKLEEHCYQREIERNRILEILEKILFKNQNMI